LRILSARRAAEPVLDGPVILVGENGAVVQNICEGVSSRISRTVPLPPRTLRAALGPALTGGVLFQSRDHAGRSCFLENTMARGSP
jgi:hypothetical protein